MSSMSNKDLARVMNGRFSTIVSTEPESHPVYNNKTIYTVMRKTPSMPNKDLSRIMGGRFLSVGPTTSGVSREIDELEKDCKSFSSFSWDSEVDFFKSDEAISKVLCGGFITIGPSTQDIIDKPSKRERDENDNRTEKEINLAVAIAAIVDRSSMVEAGWTALTNKLIGSKEAKGLVDEENEQTEKSMYPSVYNKLFHNEKHEQKEESMYPSVYNKLFHNSINEQKEESMYPSVYNELFHNSTNEKKEESMYSSVYNEPFHDETDEQLSKDIEND